MSDNSFEYSELDLVTYANMVKNRIRDLEAYHAQMNLRISAPAPSDVITPQDHDNLSRATTSLEFLKAQLEQTEQKIKNPATPNS